MDNSANKESYQELTNLLKEGIKEFRLELKDSQINDLFTYKEILKEWNEKINLTAIEEDRDVIIKHFVDSLSIVPFLQDKSVKAIDIGTGAGFPGIPIKIAYKNIDMTLFDSLDKRIKFLNEVVTALNLSGIRAVHGRAEEFGVKLDYREKFDVAVARAVANLPVLLEYCLPFVKVGGIFIAMKGSSTEEIGNSHRALELLGGSIEEVKDFVLPFSDIKRNIIIIKKLRHTPTRYPRKAGKPSKEPLI